MVTLDRKHKGMVYTWIVVLAAIFIVSCAWIIMSQMYVPNIFPEYGEQLDAFPETQTTYNTIVNVWNYWPLIFIFGLIAWAFARSQKREYDSYNN